MNVLSRLHDAGFKSTCWPRIATIAVLAYCGVALPDLAKAALVSYWAGDGNATDSVGANSGTVQNGVTFGPGVVGQAFHFDGTSYVVAPTFNLPTGNQDRTLALWFEVEHFGVQSESFFAGYGGFGTFDAAYLLGTLGDGYGAGSRTVFFSQWGSGAPGPGDPPSPVGVGEWHHLAVTNVGGLATLYLDGAIVGTQDLGGSINTSVGSSFYMGRIPGELGDVRKLEGFVDDVRVYDTALSPGEIAALAAAPEPSTFLLATLAGLGLLAFHRRAG